MRRATVAAIAGAGVLSMMARLATSACDPATRDYEPTAEFGNPPRLGQDIINEAQQNLAVTQGVASFFIHPDDDPLSVLQQVVTGLKALGYTFVSPATLMSTNG
jgi:hypothetical protein